MGYRSFISDGDCEVCGKSFSRTRYDAKYCSSTCRSRAMRAPIYAANRRRDLVEHLQRFLHDVPTLVGEDLEVVEKVERIARNAVLGASEQRSLFFDDTREK